MKGKQTGNLTSEANSNASCILSKLKKSKKKFSKITKVSIEKRRIIGSWCTRLKCNRLDL